MTQMIRELQLQLAGKNSHILIAASREVHHQYVTLGHRRSDPNGLGHGVRAFKRRQNSFSPRQLHHRIERGRIVARHILRTA